MGIWITETDRNNNQCTRYKIHPPDVQGLSSLQCQTHWEPQSATNTELSMKQFGFLKGKGTINAFFVVRILAENIEKTKGFLSEVCISQEIV